MFLKTNLTKSNSVLFHLAVMVTFILKTESNCSYGDIGGSGRYELNIIIEIHKSHIQFHPKNITAIAQTRD